MFPRDILCFSTWKYFVTLRNIHLHPGGLVDEESPGEPGEVHILVLQVLHHHSACVVYMREPLWS